MSESSDFIAGVQPTYCIYLKVGYYVTCDWRNPHPDIAKYEEADARLLADRKECTLEAGELLKQEGHKCVKPYFGHYRYCGRARDRCTGEGSPSLYREISLFNADKFRADLVADGHLCVVVWGDYNLNTKWCGDFFRCKLLPPLPPLDAKAGYHTIGVAAVRTPVTIRRKKIKRD